MKNYRVSILYFSLNNSLEQSHAIAVCDVIIVYYNTTEKSFPIFPLCLEPNCNMQ